MHNAETKAPPSQEPRDHRVQAARATFSQIHRYDPKASNDAVMWRALSIISLDVGSSGRTSS